MGFSREGLASRSGTGKKKIKTKNQTQQTAMPCQMALLVCAVGVSAVYAPHNGPKSVLYFVVDDLRPSSNAFGQTMIHTPNLDRLASSGTVFEKAYAQVAVCAPSRTSFMTGRRPRTTTCYNFKDHFRLPGIGPNWTSLPQHFKNNGYLVLGGGKTFHPNLPPNYDEPLSWSQDREYFPLNETGCGSDVCTVPDSKESELFDYQMADKAISYLRLANQTNRPFFFAVGIRRPHLHWKVPESTWAIYANATTTLPTQRSMDQSIPDIAWSDEAFGGARLLNGSKYTNPGPRGSFPDDVIRELRLGYYAAVTWADSQIGRVIDELEALGLANSTIVAVHGDHGYQLGEKNLWTKHTNFELGTRVGLTMRVPWLKKSIGARVSKRIVEMVDLYKTFSELAGLPAPESGVEGTSFARAFEDPKSVPTNETENVGWSQYPRCPKDESKLWDNTDCKVTERSEIKYMGFSMRTLGWRYTVWLKFDGENNRGLWEDCEKDAQSDSFCERELYAHTNSTTDYDSFEPVNLASQSQYVHVVASHHARARVFFDG